jgi:hypothetical protein
MELRTCRVTVKDMEGIAHTVQVTATTLYEAVALGLKAIRGNDWVEGIPDGLNTVTIVVRSVPVEHTVQLKTFTGWLSRSGGSPAEMTKRKRIKEILGISAASRT